MFMVIMVFAGCALLAAFHADKGIKECKVQQKRAEIKAKHNLK